MTISLLLVANFLCRIIFLISQCVSVVGPHEFYGSIAHGHIRYDK